MQVLSLKVTFEAEMIDFDIVEVFKNHLKNKGLSLITIRNYTSDLNHFLIWLKKTESKTAPSLRASLEEIKRINFQTIEEYKKVICSQDMAKSTINRRLATLRLFCQFCSDKGLLERDPALRINNLPVAKTMDKKINDLVSKFGSYLKKQNCSRNTIKNYTADIRNFLLELNVRVNN